MGWGVILVLVYMPSILCSQLAVCLSTGVCVIGGLSRFSSCMEGVRGFACELGSEVLRVKDRVELGSGSGVDEDAGVGDGRGSEPWKGMMSVFHARPL